jgi:lipopolysaccharide export system permease protein
MGIKTYQQGHSMIFSKIWERYFLREILTAFSFCFFAVYGLYVIVDYASRSGIYRAIHVSFIELSGYYFSILIQRLDIFVPFALLVGTIHTLCQLNVHNELIALMTSGVRFRKLLTPFLIFALTFTGLLYLNGEYLLPKAMEYRRAVEDAHFMEKYKSVKNQSLHSIELEDGSLFLYHRYDSIHHYFFDAYWVRSINQIYRIKYLEHSENKLLGKFVDRFARTSTGELISEQSFNEMEFSDLKISDKELTELLITPQERPISKLWQSLFASSQPDKKAQIATSLYYKMAMPWLAFLAFIGPAPFCLRFTRQLPVFFIYLISIVTMVAFYLIMNAAFILGEYQTFNPFLAIFVPFSLFAIPLVYRFLKIK